MTRWLGICAALITISAVSLVLHWGTSGRAGTPPFELGVLVLSVTTPLASLLLTWHLWRDGYRALLSGSPLMLMIVLSALALFGAAPSLKLLLWLDLYVLLAFIVVLGGFGRQILRLSSHLSQRAPPPQGRPNA